MPLFKDLMVKNKNYDLIILVIASYHTIYAKIIENYWVHLIKKIKERNLRIKIIMVLGRNQPIISNENDLIYGPGFTKRPLVAAKNEEPSDKFGQGPSNLVEYINSLELQKKRTALEIFQKTKLIFFSTLTKEDILVVDVHESVIPGILMKTMTAINVINEEYEYKHIFRTNVSSFLILDKLIKIHNSLQDENIFAGVIGETNNIKFVSGAGYWLSRDNVEFIIKNIKNLDVKLHDDVAVCKLMENRIFTSLPRYSIEDNVNIIDKEELLAKIIQDNHYHIRIKNTKDRYLDIEYIRAFANMLYGPET